MHKNHNATSSTVSHGASWLHRALSSRTAAALTYPHGVDHFLSAFDTTAAAEEIRARIVSTQRQTADTVTVVLAPNANWRGFQAGQYVRFSVDVGGVRRTRCFSPANSMHCADGTIELTCKIGPDSIVSRHLAERAAPGERVWLSQAEGAFALPVDRPRRVLLISGGSGITSVMAMLRTLCDEAYAGRITFLHYANMLADQLYADALRAIAADHPNVELLRSYAAGDAAGELQGLFSAGQLAQAVPDYAQAQTFLCGPPGMMKAVQAVYEGQGIGERLHIEYFSAAAQAVDTADASGEVRFARSERLAANDGDTLLNQAEGAGLKPESGCRMGICHACTCRKLSGRVRDTRTGEVGDGGEEDIQICVSVPVGSVILDI